MCLSPFQLGCGVRDLQFNSHPLWAAQGTLSQHPHVLGLGGTNQSTPVLHGHKKTTSRDGGEEYRALQVCFSAVLHMCWLKGERPAQPQQAAERLSSSTMAGSWAHLPL